MEAVKTVLVPCLRCGAVELEVNDACEEDWEFTCDKCLKKYGRYPKW